MAVNITNYFENATSVGDILNVPNLTTGGFAWIGLLIMMQVIIMISFLPFGFIGAMLSSAFIALIVGMFFTYMDLISWQWLMFFLGQIIFMIIYITWQQKR